MARHSALPSLRQVESHKLKSQTRETYDLHIPKQNLMMDSFKAQAEILLLHSSISPSSTSKKTTGPVNVFCIYPFWWFCKMLCFIK